MTKKKTKTPKRLVLWRFKCSVLKLTRRGMSKGELAIHFLMTPKGYYLKINRLLDRYPTFKDQLHAAQVIGLAIRKRGKQVVYGPMKARLGTPRPPTLPDEPVEPIPDPIPETPCAPIPGLKLSPFGSPEPNQDPELVKLWREKFGKRGSHNP